MILFRTAMRISACLKTSKSLIYRSIKPVSVFLLRYLRERLVRHVDSFNRELAIVLLAKGCR